MFGKLRDKDACEGDLARLQMHYNRYLEAGSKNSLFKATFRAFAKDVCLQMVLGFFTALLNFTSPWLILKLTAFI